MTQSLNPLDEIIELRGALRDLLEAVKRARDVGCLDHLDCWETADKEWYQPIERARAAMAIGTKAT